MNYKTLKINPSDNIAVALTDLKKNHIINVNDKKYKLVNNIKAKHKFSTQKLNIGDPIYMYGVTVGTAKKNIKKGEQITTTNIIHETEEYSVPKKFKKKKWESPSIKNILKTTFKGYHRDDGKVGTENNWLVIPLVFCQNRNIEKIKKNMLKSLGYENQNDEDYDLSEIIEKYKSGANSDELLKVNLQKKRTRKKSNI